MTAWVRRREFITLLGGAAAAWPLAARAQQAANLPTIGILGSGSAAWSHLVSALMQRLRELGYIENRTVAIEYRWTEGRNERYAAMAAELVGLKVDIIVALGTPAIVAARKATAVIPIVFPIASDPVGDGLVASLARPGGNVTGLSNSAARSCRQTARNSAGDHPRSQPIGGVGQRPQSHGHPERGRSPSRRSQARPRSQYTRCQARGRYCACHRPTQGPHAGNLCRWRFPRL